MLEPNKLMYRADSWCLFHTLMAVSNTRLYVPYDCVNGFRKSILAGYKTQTIRFWGGKTTEQFKNRVLDQHLVRLGGRSQSSCWGHARIHDLQVMNIRDLTEDDISREGAPVWVTNYFFEAVVFHSSQVHAHATHG